MLRGGDSGHDGEGALRVTFVRRVKRGQRWDPTGIYMVARCETKRGQWRGR